MTAIGVALGLSANQLANAQGILRAVKFDFKLPVECAVITVETVLVESGMRMLASANVPESQKYPHDLLSWTDDGLGHDHASMGMYQQQTGWAWTPANHGHAIPPGQASMQQSTMGSPNGWGVPRDLMNSEIGTGKFLRVLISRGWQGKTRWQAAQDVQGSAFADGSNYRSQDERAQQIVAALWPSIGAVTTGEAADMYQLLKDASTGHWYGYAAGYWHFVAHQAEFDRAATSPLCVNGKYCNTAVRRASKINQRHFLLTAEQIKQAKAFATGNGK